MPRFFTETVYPDIPFPPRMTLGGDNAFHLVRVLRAKQGEPVTVVAGDGKEYACRFLEAGDAAGEVTASLEVLSVKEAAEKKCRVTLVQGMPKGKKTDLILQKATELGADRIVFVYMDRSVPARDGGGEGKLARFRRIVSEAASQCGRSSIPAVSFLPDLSRAIPLLKESETVFACYESERQRRLSDVIGHQTSSIGFLIGPEGGISNREIDLLEEAGIPTVSLGERILRTETAPLAVLSMILYETELRN
ncbi:MAG: 16S rRNA (uracil(1498)-N(3))-methyltransferase [Clostridia bacterium]|nr:16S rRNA (uracil(1498)-N(3))-methyltransferase [Clostridia bacterium]